MFTKNFLLVYPLESDTYKIGAKKIIPGFTLKGGDPKPADIIEIWRSAHRAQSPLTFS